ncbi:MAG: TadE family protein [Chloroflexota bacterium]
MVDAMHNMERKPQMWQRGQALVETALVVPLLLFLAFGVVGVGRVTQAQLGVAAVAREAALAGALANNAEEALARGSARGQEVATGYNLRNGTLGLAVDVGTFGRGGQVRTAARYEVRLDDLPLMGWARIVTRSEHSERVDPYRSRWPGGG